jgi:arylsulfatase A-like enzyme
MDGRSLLATETRDELFLEQLDNWRVGLPDWRSIRTAEFQYTEYYDRHGELMEREYYDLVADPFQLTNLFGDRDPSNDPDADALHLRIETYRDCVAGLCFDAP